MDQRKTGKITDIRHGQGNVTTTVTDTKGSWGILRLKYNLAKLEQAAESLDSSASIADTERIHKTFPQRTLTAQMASL